MNISFCFYIARTLAEQPFSATQTSIVSHFCLKFIINYLLNIWCSITDWETFYFFEFLYLIKSINFIINGQEQLINLKCDILWQPSFVANKCVRLSFGIFRGPMAFSSRLRQIIYFVRGYLFLQSFILLENLFLFILYLILILRGISQVL